MAEAEEEALEDLAVRLRGVGRTIPPADGKAEPVRVLRGVDLDLPRGGCLHVLGPSGSGKTSLLRLVNRLDEASEGSVEVLGRTVGDWPVRALRRHVAMVFQEPSLLGRTVRENLRLPFSLDRDAPADLEDRLHEAIQAAGLDETFLDREAGEMSVGQKQRAALARALVTRPEVLLLDEPTSNLDRGTAHALLDRLETMRTGRGLSLLMVTHRMEEARAMGGRVLVLLAGRPAASGALEDLLREPPGEEVARFLEGGPRGSG